MFKIHALHSALQSDSECYEVKKQIVKYSENKHAIYYYMQFPLGYSSLNDLNEIKQKSCI